MGMADAAGEQAMTPLRLPMVALGLSAPIGFVLVAGQQAPAAVYSAAQAAAGRTVYQASCASCHLADLAGRNEAPQLAGNNFMNTWRTRSTRDLFEKIQTMPPTGASLSDDQYLAVTAFILQVNGAAAGAQAFTPTTAVPVGAGASGAAPGAGAGARQAQTTTADDAAAGRGAGGRGVPGAATGRGGAPANAGPLGLTVTGTVKNYVPVTDEMLRNQDPG